jgi:hypothetical protein
MLLGNVQALGLKVPVSPVMARQSMPKALSSLQSDKGSYTSESSGIQSSERVPREFEFSSVPVFGEFREFGLRSSESYQGCSGYDGCGVAVIYALVSCKPERVQRDSVVIG